MSFTTDPATRQAFITGLRDLADYLDQHPLIPVPTNQGLCQLIAEGGTPRRVKVAYLTDDHIIGLAALAAHMRRDPAAA